ncbi:PHP domain-containing protein (plasmid) [Bacillus velezensis]|uniref:PHP domain-containing protein n=1 Tax=Bacillus velezensis TaxID=492670 RepID=UPI00049FF7A9|nr:PHP domain-containing protein [Bacillus velezensis]KDN91225.1 DNA polymerase III subunit alpha [Bacillus amyloliquefaciens]URJ76379.1 PHP domain-containing protein [Bacillus velezensis]URJ80335.1 PHP domain-containing protein [Bacillus velezensis]
MADDQEYKHALDKHYTALHLHTHLSNQNMVEVVNNYKQYIDKAVEMGHKAIAFTEHGNILSWYNKKIYAEEKGLKFIHGCEVYVTMTLEEKKRDNFHLVLLAKNYEGFKELNKMVSTGFDRKGNNFYYNPRISWDDIKNTSKNIIISSACLGGPIWQLYKNRANADDEVAKGKYEEVIQWFSDNKDRAFLEIQPHYHVEQIQYNKLLLHISESTGIRLVAASDTHALNEEYDKARKVLQKAKRINFTDEDTFDLSFHSYEKMVEMFSRQEVFTEEQIHDALQLSNVIADMVESWEIDYSKKYPQLYDNPEEVFRQKITEGIKLRGIDKLPVEEKRKYAERIQLEYDVYKANEAINYMLLEDDVKSYARSKNVRYGWGRGSVSGSIIAYLMQITQMNSIERKLNFARFMSKERISLADIDTDYEPSKRHVVQDYLLNHPKLSCAHIITYNTIALKGAIRDVGRGLNMSLDEVAEIAKNAEEHEQYYRDKYPELFHYVDLIKGTVVSIGAHACGIAVSPLPLDEYMGTITTIDSETKQPIVLTQINMKEIDAQNYVKLDILGLDTVELISETVDLAGLEWKDVFPENLDSEDENVWASIHESNIGVFQYESDFAHQIYKDLFSADTIRKIREKHPNFSYMDLFSLGNAILRPSGASYREFVVQGQFYDNGHEKLNKFLAPTLGRLVYQEDIINFLTDFCGYSGGEADVVRRAIGKKQKEVLEKVLPEIKQRFIDTMVKEHGVRNVKAEEISEPFIKVIIDSSDYGFSINHSDAYSWFGYTCAWLRYYYPLEFLTASLNVNIGKQDKTAKLVEYAKSKGISLKGIKFRYSRSGYMFDKDSSSIYQGIEPIKYLNSQVAEGLYKLKDRKYSSFTELLIDIKEGVGTIEIYGLDGGSNKLDFNEFLSDDFTSGDLKYISTLERLGGGIKYTDMTPVPVNSRQMQILISLGYFEEFGGNKKLLRIYKYFENMYKKTLKIKSKVERKAKVLLFEKELVDESLSLVEQCEHEFTYLGHIETINKETPANIMMIVEVLKNKSYVRAKAYQFSTGETREFKIGSRTYDQVPFEETDVIQIINAEIKPKNKKIDGRWQKSPTEKEAWLKEVKFVRKAGQDDEQ